MIILQPKILNISTSIVEEHFKHSCKQNDFIMKLVNEYKIDNRILLSTILLTSTRISTIVSNNIGVQTAIFPDIFYKSLISIFSCWIFILNYSLSQRESLCIAHWSDKQVVSCSVFYLNSNMSFSPLNSHFYTHCFSTVYRA